MDHAVGIVLAPFCLVPFLKDAKHVYGYDDKTELDRVPAQWKEKAKFFRRYSLDLLLDLM